MATDPGNGNWVRHAKCPWSSLRCLQYHIFPRNGGDQDRCFYNFQCMKPIGPFSMGNHILSNIGYIVLGVLFLKVVRMRELLEREKRKENEVSDKGVALDYGLFYTMGLNMVMIGLMSACYHICPTTISFQFDTTFMYLIAVLMFMKLYQVVVLLCQQ